MPGFDVRHSDFILSFGSGLIEGWESPVYMFKGKSALRHNGGRMDQIEPRLSKTAAKSDKWIAIKPGTEGALALGIAHVIVKEGLYRGTSSITIRADLSNGKRQLWTDFHLKPSLI